MKTTKDGQVTFRILVWGSVLKRNFLSSLSNKLQDLSSNFSLEPTRLPPKEVNEIFWESNIIRSQEFDKLSFELYNVGYKHPPSGTKNFYLDWLDDYTVEEQAGLREMFADTDGVLFIANANNFVEDRKGMNIKPVNEWERTQKSLRLLHEIAGNSLGVSIPLVNLIIYPASVGRINPLNSPNVISNSQYTKMLSDYGLESENVIIFESLLPPTGLPTKVFNAFSACLRSVGLSKIKMFDHIQCEENLDLSSTFNDIYASLLKII